MASDEKLTTIDEREQDFKRTFESCCLPPGVYSEFRRHLEQVREEERERCIKIMADRYDIDDILRVKTWEDLQADIRDKAKGGDDGE